MRKLIVTLSAALFFIFSAAAQNRTITGTVNNEKGAPMTGVTVSTPDGKAATQTISDGTYSLKVPNSVKNLIFSYVNYESVTAAIGRENAHVFVTMKQADTKLEEVVVVGYGTQKKKEVTGSTSTIKGSAIANKPVQSFDQALAGRASGVQITVPSGVLNSPPVFRIRGTNTITASAYPLIIVDGIPTPTGDFSSTNSAGNALASINPNDIESIDILKDASSAAIYGSRAANGVVLITTKKGKTGKARINYSASFGFTNVYGVPQVLNAQQYTDYKNMALANQYLLNSTNPAAANYYHFNMATDANGNIIDTKWANAVYRQGFNQDHNLNVSGANEFTSYYFSAGFTKQEGILRNNDFARKNILMNLETKPNKIITIGGKISYSDELNLAATTSGSLSGEAFNTGGLGRTVIVNAPNVGVYKNDGTYNISAGGNYIGSGNNIINGNVTGSQVGFYNPVVFFDKNRSNSETNHIQSNIYAQVKPLNWITLRTVFGIDYLWVDNDIFQTPLHGDGFAAIGNASSNLTKYKRYTWTNSAQFDYTFKRNHTFSALIGQEQDRRTILGYGINRQSISDPAYTVIQAGWGLNNTAGTAGNLSENYLLSGFGRFTYDFKKKYFISANLRQDEYSALPGQKETFYGFGGGWEISKEKFWYRMKKAISSLKLHGSYGKVGNTAGIADFGTYSTYGSGLYGGNSSLVFNQAGNSNLKWETSIKTDFGATFGILKDRVTFEASYYKNDVSNLILNVPQSPSTGLPTSIPQNVGKMYNKGFELSVTAVPINSRDFTWTSNFNYTANQNIVTQLAPGLTEVLSASSGLETVNRTAVGFSVGSAWLVRTAGVDPKTGSRVLLNAIGNRILYRNVPRPGQFNYSYEDGTRYNKADGSQNTINQRDDAVMYNVIPKYVGGFSNNFRFMNFDLDVLFTYQAGFYIYYGTNAGLHDQRFWNNAVDVLTAWKQPGDITTVPRPVFGDNLSNGSALPMDFNLFKGDFIKLKNLTLGYNLPAIGLGKAKISNARFYVSGQNLAIWTKYPGPDPEVSSNGNTASAAGVDRNTIANGRTMIVGINIGL